MPKFLAQRFNATARNEIILAAGTTNTPHILMLSGIGPAADLAAHNIPTIRDIPAVGANLVDHILSCVSFRVDEPDFFTYDTIFKNTTLLDQYREEWRVHGTGPMTNGVTKQLAWIRLPDNDPIWTEVHVDPSAGRRSAHIEFFFTVSTRLFDFTI